MKFVFASILFRSHKCEQSQSLTGIQSQAASLIGVWQTNWAIPYPNWKLLMAEISV